MIKINKEKNNISISVIIIIIAILIILLTVLILFSSKKVDSFNLNTETKNDTTKVQENSNQTYINDSENKHDNMIIKITDDDDKNNIENNDKTEEQSNATNNKIREFGENVAFIGDSRTQAFLMYTGLNKVVDYTSIGLMVDTAFTKKFITNQEGEKITLLDDLKNRNVDTVYIMLGVNELGWVYSSIFIKKYEELIDKIQELKPNCEIIVQSIIPVTKTKSDSDSIYNNTRITEYNTLIKDMANRKNIEFIDLVPVLTDKNGNLPEEASPDGIHLNKEYCLKWLDCLKNN